MHRPRYSLLILTILVLLTLQVTILPLIEIHKVRPDLLLIAVCFVGFQWGLWLGLGVGLFAGLLKDCFSQGLLGGYAFCFGLLGLVCGCLERPLYRERHFTQVVITLLASVSSFFLYYCLVKLYRAMPPIAASFRYVILPASVYTAIFALPLFYILPKIFGVSTLRR